ncbi:DUF6680 family protein [Bradyrhizobium sp. PRIMUS42]|uniref:DUF6680 family protein n=1 Tax=Bradyrhizobium sp. PRIMUS42 TaxID=2908926 RepID=UPI001FF29C6E|nr:DUF6680 family protein [Bradyrhizobium sp. PRIMUS42]MCJ9733761.1 hypothetical protein [Bradyrhizobium sp. PRIMUS42]
MAEEAASILKMSDAVIAACTLIGPILAVQAQKWIEGYREKRDRRFNIFRTLMATRAANLTAAHVEAINAVPIDFYGDKPIIDAWEEYFEHLTKSTEVDALWGQRRIDLFTKLLAAIGQRVGYAFSAAQMNRIYFPNAHGRMEEDANAIRVGMAALFKGDFHLPLAIKSIPVDPATAELQMTLHRKMNASYEDDGSLRVRITEATGD